LLSAMKGLRHQYFNASLLPKTKTHGKAVHGRLFEECDRCQVLDVIRHNNTDHEYVVLPQHHLSFTKADRLGHKSKEIRNRFIMWHGRHEHN
jgi:hypothetical protein